MKCENCNKEHEGNFASGRFCSRNCSAAFSTKSKRKEINIKISNTLSVQKIEKFCMECGNIFYVIPCKEYRKFCSNHCSNTYINRTKKITGVSQKVRQKISKTRKQLFSDNKLSVTGGTAKWIEYKDIKVQGTYELRTCYILDKWKDLGTIKDWEYTRDRISYTNADNKCATYLLDFKIIKNNNDVVYIETKGFIRENDELKWEACKNLNMNLKVWFIEDIEKYENDASLAVMVQALS